MTATDLSPETPRSGSLPSWVIVIVVMLALATAGYLGYRQFFASPSEGVVIDVGNVDQGRAPPSMARMMRNAVRAAPPADGVQQFGANFRARAGPFVALLSPQQATGKARIAINHRDENSPNGEAALADGDVGRILSSLRGMNMDTKFADELKLTPAQRQKLQAIPTRRTLIVSQDGEAKLRATWSKYYAADSAGRPALEPELIAALKEVGEASLTATKAEFADRAEKVKAILTPEQLAEITK